MALAGLVAGGPRAYADVGTGTYSVLAPQAELGPVSASPDVVVAGATADFVVSFVTTVPLLKGSDLGVAVSLPLSSSPSGVVLVDNGAGACEQVGTGGGELSPSNFTVQLTGACQLGAGDQVSVEFTAAAPSSQGSFYFEVTTSASTSPATSNAVVVSASPPVLLASSSAVGAPVTLSTDGASWAAGVLSAPFSALALTAKALSGPPTSWPEAPSAYTVSYTTASGAAGEDQVTGAEVAVAGSQSVTLVLASPLGPGAQVDVTASATGPSAPAAVEVTITPEAALSGPLVPVGPGETTNPVSFGTSVTDVAVVASPPTPGAQATYTVSFVATSAISGGPGAAVCLSEEADGTWLSDPSWAVVADPKAGWDFVAGGGGYSGPPSQAGASSSGSCSPGPGGAVVYLPAGYDVRPGDLVTVVLGGVTNPGPGVVSDFSVSTSADPVVALAAPYVVEAGAPGASVTVSPPTTGALATYVISGLVATAPLAGGTGSVTIEAPLGTVFPDTPSDYVVGDSTSPGSSGAVTQQVVGGGTNEVSVTVPRAVAVGDAVTVVVNDVVNPGEAGSYQLILLGDVVALRTPPPFPGASETYPNGAIINFSGSDYVMAGGHAFGFTGPSQLGELEAVDHAEVQTALPGAVPPDGPPRPGTLVTTSAVSGVPTVYVVGPDYKLHGFATWAQLVREGYDPALVVTVPSLAGVPLGGTVGAAGAALDALATSSDGAVALSLGHYYVLAGGRGFLVPGEPALAQLSAADKAKPLPGELGAGEVAAPVANGVLISSKGKVYVAFQGELWLFKSQAQLVADGYGGTAAVPVPTLGSAPVIASYSGL